MKALLADQKDRYGKNMLQVELTQEEEREVTRLKVKGISPLEALVVVFENKMKPNHSISAKKRPNDLLPVRMHAQRDEQHKHSAIPSVQDKDISLGGGQDHLNIISNEEDGESSPSSLRLSPETPPVHRVTPPDHRGVPPAAIPHRQPPSDTSAYKPQFNHQQYVNYIIHHH